MTRILIKSVILQRAGHVYWTKHKRRSVPFFLVLGVGLFTAAANAQETSPTIESLNQALNEAQGYQLGEPDTALAYIHGEVLRLQGDPEGRNELANLLAAFLDDAGSTDAFFNFVCRQLYLIGGEEQIDELSPMLLDPKRSHMARYALEVIPSDAVDAALWGALPHVDGATATGLVSSLAARGGKEAIPRLTQLLLHDDIDVVRVAIIGLGRRGGAAAELALRHAHATVPETLYPEVFEALLACADGYKQDNNPIEAARLYQELMAVEQPFPVRLAAFRGMVHLDSEQSVYLILDALRSDKVPWVLAACGYIRTERALPMVEGVTAPRAFASTLEVLPPGAQIALIHALAERGDPEALDAIYYQINSVEESVQEAAIAAMGDLGNETHGPELVDVMMFTESDTAPTLGRETLVRMADVGVDGALLREFDARSPDAQIAIMDVLAARRATGAIPRLLRVAGETSDSVQSTALKTLGKLASAADIPSLYQLYLSMDSETPRNEARSALLATLRRMPADEERSELMRGMYGDAPTSVTRGGLLTLYRELGDDTMLPLVLAGIEAPDSLEQQYSIEALVDWPTPTPMADVLALAKRGNVGAQLSDALHGYVRMVRLPADRSSEDSLAGLVDVLKLSNDADIVRRVLAALSELRSTAALDVVEGLMEQDDIHQEAAVAAEKIRRSFYRVDTSENTAIAQNAVDDDVKTSWETNGPQRSGQWLEIDMSRPARIKGIVLDTAPEDDTFPRAYEVYVYTTPEELGDAIARGEGTSGPIAINTPPTTGRWVRIVQTGTTNESPWSVREVRILPE